MKHLSLIASALAVLGLTACEKGLDVEEDGVSSGNGQVTNSLLQVRTRAGGAQQGVAGPLGGRSSSRRKATPEVLARVGQLLEKECVGKRLYLAQELTLSELSAAVGVNRNYIGQYFASQNTTYYNYIHDLRVNHFMRLCREAVAARRPFKAQQLALDSGFRSYSTFASAFKQRTGQSVASWVSRLEVEGLLTF